MHERNYRFTLSGKMPLLMHADDVEKADELQAWRKDPKNKNLSKPGDDRSPAWTWQTYLYRDGEHVTVPAENLMVCLRYAGTQIAMKGNKTFKQASQSGMLIDGEYLDFRCDGKKIAIADVDALRKLTFAEQAAGVRKMGFALFAKRAKVGQSKHIRVRPRFDAWTLSGSIEVYAEEITDDVLRQMFAIGGDAGLCDWRPNCKTPGPYGMFDAEVTKL